VRRRTKCNECGGAVVMVFSALAGATVSGVFFGWYPARRAAATDWIDALRCE
jgi:ABC-type lipoprotein release transport system permease subunit